MIGKPGKQPKRAGKKSDMPAWAEDEGAEPMEDEEDGEDEDLSGVAAEEVLSAIQAEDSAALKDALKAFVRACQADSEEY
jgi:hypothetical protein